MNRGTSKEALDNLVHCKSITRCKECKHKNLCTMERDYIIINRELKVLEIIKNKRVNVNTLVSSIIGAINPLDFYNEKVGLNLKLTQQEFDLLKEWLENE